MFIVFNASVALKMASFGLNPSYTIRCLYMPSVMLRCMVSLHTHGSKECITDANDVGRERLHMAIAIFFPKKFYVKVMG